MASSAPMAPTHAAYPHRIGPPPSQPGASVPPAVVAAATPLPRPRRAPGGTAQPAGGARLRPALTFNQRQKRRARPPHHRSAAQLVPVHGHNVAPTPIRRAGAPPAGPADGHVGRPAPYRRRRRRRSDHRHRHRHRRPRPAMRPAPSYPLPTQRPFEAAAPAP